MLKIEKNVPIPDRGAIGISATLRLMEPGDSFCVPAEYRASIQPSVRRLGMKVATRKEGDVVRVWRVA